MVHYGRMPASSWCGVPGRGYTDDRTTAGKNREVLQPRGVNNCKSISLCHIFTQLMLVTVGQFAPGVVLRTAVTVCTQLVGCCAASAIVKIKRVSRSQCDVVGIRHWNPVGWTDSTVCVSLQHKLLSMRVVGRRGRYKLVQGAGAVLVNKVNVTGPVEFDALV